MNQEKRLKLSYIKLKGFKSIAPEGQTIDFQDITVLLGANGSGKSNLVSFFSMLNYMMTEALQIYIGENGGAETLLYYGAKKTNRAIAEMEFTNPKAKDIYKFSLSHAAGDTVIFTEETISYQQQGRESPYTFTLDPGRKESGLPERAKDRNNRTERVVFELLRRCQVFQFHDTSKAAKIRNKGYIDDNIFLRSDAGNLAAFLYAMQNSDATNKYYRRIIRYIQQIMPQFGDFELKPSRLNENYIMLNWQEKGADYLFGPHQISDGSLRFMAIATLLLQPPETLPAVIVLDEPELGLHPSAIAVLAGMARTASINCQIVMATQSPRLVDEFEPENILIVERNSDNSCSEFKSLDSEKLTEWLERYSLSELWEKNVIGGQP
ncbi:MAG: AAA family ATPase [Hormoscilla sp. GUM202]|nr:AAA family ATPase [Hormoscilla sp. GUM202]